MIMRCALSLIQILPLVAVAIAIFLAAPGSAAAAVSERAGSGIEVAIPGVVSLMTYVTAGVLLIGLAVARRRPTV